MKTKLLLALLLCFTLTTTASAQKKSKIDRKGIISYQDLQEWRRANNRSYGGYIASDGHLYQLGDKLTIGKVEEGKTYSYMWERLNVFTILADEETHPISGKWVGSTGVIKAIEVWGTRNSGHDVVVVLGVGELYRIEVRPFEAALSSGEIVSEGMTRDKAIKELKEAKELLELEVISQEEYDQIKNSLNSYILKK